MHLRIVQRPSSCQPDLADAYIDRTLAHEGMRQYKESIADFTQALNLGTPRTRVYFMRAIAKNLAGDKAGARQDNEEGLKQEPSDDYSWIARGEFRQNLAKDPQGAIADYDRALELNPRSVFAMQNKSAVLSDLGRTDDAIAVLNKAVEFYPDYVPARAGRGVLLARKGKWAEAANDAQGALIRDSNPPNLYQVGCIYALNAKNKPDDRFQAFPLLSSALNSGFGLEWIDTDKDLDPIRECPEFIKLVAEARRPPPRPEG